MPASISSSSSSTRCTRCSGGDGGFGIMSRAIRTPRLEAAKAAESRRSAQVRANVVERAGDVLDIYRVAAGGRLEAEGPEGFEVALEGHQVEAAAELVGFRRSCASAGAQRPEERQQFLDL